MRAEFHENEKRPSFNLEHFFELSADLFCIAGYDGFFKKINSAVSKVLGYTEEELMAVPIASFIHPDDRAITARYRDELLNGEPLLHFENRYITKTGDIVWLSWTSMPAPEEKLVYAIAKNITHKKSEEADRNKLIAELGNLNADLKQLSYTTSHDLRSPVNNLLSVFNLLNKHTIEDEEVHRFLAILQSGTETLKVTLNDYVDLLSKNQHLKIEKEEVYFDDVCKTVCRSIQTLITDSKASIETDFDSMPAVYFNRSYLESVFLNLISNAIKYAFPGRPPVIELHSWEENGELLLSVTDNGRGFDMEKVKDRIFGMHQRFHEHNDSKGIGLYLVHHHVTIMGGSITVNSEPDKGTSFVISFAKQ
ncbi:MAG TPA: PAS domain-containing sensor histidine kinase [Chitinophagaceae bacterium]|nr:PAS domain-containing sensor histidine kinase [Chitinophagaceae bacterium]